MKKYLYALLTLLTLGFTVPGKAEPSKQAEPVVILGGGVGALTSSIYLQRAGIPTIVIEGQTPGGAIAQSPMVHNWPGEINIDGQTLVDKIRKQAEVNGATIVSEEVVNVDFSNRPFKIETRDIFDTEKKRTIQARSCIIALGSQPKLLGVPGESGEKGYWTRGVYSCAVCDGALYKDKTVAVIGGGDSAIIEADYLSKIAEKVYVVLRSGQFRTVETLRKNQLVKKSNVEVLYNTKVQEIIGDGKKVTHVDFSTGKKLPIDAVFVAIGATPNSKLFEGQLDLDQNGYISLLDDQQTSVPGVYAIGDVVDPVYNQAITAAGDGAKAAIKTEHFLSAYASPKTQLRQMPKVTVAVVKSSSSGVIELSSKEEFDKAIALSSTPILVDFYSPYCGPCKRLSPEFEKMAQKYQGKVRFMKVDVTKFPELAENYNIYGVPSVLVFDKKGNMVQSGSGLDEINKIFKDLDSMASK